LDTAVLMTGANVSVSQMFHVVTILENSSNYISAKQTDWLF